MKFSTVSLRQLLTQYLGLLLSWLLLFVLLRVLLVAATWSLRGDATVALLSRSLAHGLLFDLSMAAKVAVPFALWRIWRPGPSRIERRLMLTLFGGVAFLGIFTLVSEVEFYKEFQVRLGPLAMEYFGKPEHNRIVLGMIWHGYPVVRWMLVCLVIWSLFVWLDGASRLGDRLPRPPGPSARWPQCW